MKLNTMVGARGVACVIFGAACLGFAETGNAQGKVLKEKGAKTTDLTAKQKDSLEVARGLKRARVSEPLFGAASPLEVTLTTDIRRIRGDKGDKAPWRSAVVTYTEASGKAVAIATQIRTRGIWRLNNCFFPPLKLNFKSEVTKGTLFQGLDKPKLVNFCRDNDQYDQYIIQEMQLYRVYNLLTPASHRARLLSLTYQDGQSGKIYAKRSALLIEEAEVMAARLGGPVVDIKGAVARDLEPHHDALISLFQYFIGNTDFSINALHNVELVGQSSGDYVPVAYDFDFSGAIDASYATTDPKLPIRRVRDRLFRGYCRPAEDYAKAIATFNEKRGAIYALYSDSIGRMLRPKTVRETLGYYDDFYKTINDPRRLKREIMDDCVKTE
ncbi:MAG: hypothetical protein ABIQ55_05320 [Gemmatimonadaceae bacterium]